MEWFRGERPWPQFLRLIDRLPPHSHYKAALAMDDEYAREVVRFIDPDKEPALTPQGLTREVLALMDLTDAVISLRYVVMAQNAKRKPPTPKPMRRPFTAIQRYLKDKERNRLMSVASMFLPDDN